MAMLNFLEHLHLQWTAEAILRRTGASSRWLLPSPCQVAQQRIMQLRCEFNLVLTGRIEC